MSQFGKKTWGRIYVAKQEDIAAVNKIIEELDSFEHGYLPDGFIALWEGKIEPVYGHKFEMDIEKLTEACWQRGIHMFCVTDQSDPLTF